MPSYMGGKGDVHPEDSRSLHHWWHPSESQVKVKLIRNTKGHSWEITAEAPNPVDVVALLQETENNLKKVFGSD